MLKYRPEIDGLRAIAVLSVVIYHAQFSSGDSFFMAGGYIGVDIFFVISGFLISSIILREVQSSSFSYSDFYERRARRILPALFAVISCSIPFAWWLMLPGALKEYAASILSALLFGSNIWFWSQDSYTAEPSLLRPFLHTWSLSVEEQFYILFPILLLVLWKFARPYVLVVLVLIAIASLALSHWASSHYTDANFYLLPTRIWELLAGGLLAAWQVVRDGSKIGFSDAAREAATISAIVVLLVCFYCFDHNTLDPSLMTLVPIAATVVIIHAANPAVGLTKLLASRSIVLIGKWSYSFYLWHFPVFAFARIHAVAESSFQKICLIVVSLVLAAMTYYWVEQPLRSKDGVRRAVFIRWMIAWFVLLMISMTCIYYSNGVPQRLGVVQNLFQSAQIINVEKDGQDCHQRITSVSCSFPPKEGMPVIVNIGDSHAKVLAHELKQFADQRGFGYVQITSNICPLARDGNGMLSGKLINNCHPTSQAERLERAKKYTNSIIVISARYPLYLSREGFDNQQGGAEEIEPIWLSSHSDGRWDPAIAKLLMQATINELIDTGNVVVIVYPVPEVGWHIPEYVRSLLDEYPPAERLNAFRSLDISISYDLYKDRAASSNAMLDAIDDRANLIRIYPHKELCDDTSGRCITHTKQALLYHDDDHLGPAGAQRVVAQIEEKIATRSWKK